MTDMNSDSLVLLDLGVGCPAIKPVPFSGQNELEEEFSALEIFILNICSTLGHGQ